MQRSRIESHHTWCSVNNNNKKHMTDNETRSWRNLISVWEKIVWRRMLQTDVKSKIKIQETHASHPIDDSIHHKRDDDEPTTCEISSAMWRKVEKTDKSICWYDLLGESNVALMFCLCQSCISAIVYLSFHLCVCVNWTQSAFFQFLPFDNECICCRWPS